MKKFLRSNLFVVFIFFIFLTGCHKDPKVIQDVETFDQMITQKLEGKYEEAIAYDLRSQEDCSNGHIKGFLCMQEDGKTIHDIYHDIIHVYSKKTRIFIICEDGSRSKELATLLCKKGYKYVCYFSGGYQNYVNIHPNFTPEIGCDC